MNEALDNVTPTASGPGTRSTPVDGDSCGIVGWWHIDADVHEFWATVPPRATAE